MLGGGYPRPHNRPPGLWRHLPLFLARYGCSGQWPVVSDLTSLELRLSAVRPRISDNPRGKDFGKHIWVKVGLMFNKFMMWWDRWKALKEFQTLQVQQERSLMADDNNPLNRAAAALRIGDSDGALRFWKQARDRLPGSIKTRPEALSVLLGLNRYDEAEELMAQGLKQNSKEPFFAESLAQISQSRHDYAEAVRRWDQVRKKFPYRWKAYVQGANALRELGRLDEAELLIARALKRFGYDINCWIECARVAEAGEKWELALERWTFVDDKLDHVSGAIGAARAFKKLGRSDKAMQRLLSTQSQYGADPDFKQILAEFLDHQNQ